ncbi:MAG: formylglycine-generating enzyme family protein [Campylobacterota bacterium]|nr:formylglycine-generating enzyme family protein [Campylobacterota bacterium]
MAKFIEPQMVRIIHKKPDITLDIAMVHLPQGSFMMGSDESSDEQPIHEVTIDYEFEIGKYSVTIAQYMTFVNDTNTHHPEWMEEGSQYNIETGSDDYYKKMNLSDNAPIIGVSWHDAVAYCKWLSEKSGQSYRLPTEAEWEYACKAGTATKWSFGDDEKELDRYAWYDKNSEGKTHPVGKLEPNPWGLYDMHGNVREWCEDDYVGNYNNTPRDGGAYRSESSSSKVARGGSWFSSDFNSRSADRSSFSPTGSISFVGFRLLRALPL